MLVHLEGQIPVLAEAGYRVVAADMQGANRSGKPSGVRSYDPNELAGDAAGLIDHFGRESATVVGHDFGGLAAWHLAATQPSVVDRLGILNSPNLAVYDRHLRSSLRQLRKAWYVFFFQLLRLPEYSLSYDDHAGFEQLYESVSDAMTDADVERLKRAATRDGALRAMVSWYRGTARWYLGRLRRREGVSDLSVSVSVPTLLCWGEQDEVLSVDPVDDHRGVVDDLRIERYPAASHWPHWDARDDLNETLCEFL